MYDTVKRMRELYDCLQDEQSKNIFLDRLAIDMEPSMTNTIQLCIDGGQTSQEQQKNWKSVFQQVTDSGKKIVLYGASVVGRDIATALLYEKVDFYGFCDRTFTSFSNGLMGKPVISPNKLFSHPEKYYVVNALSSFHYAEVEQILQEHNFPQDHILKFLGAPTPNQYFEFPALYRKGTAFLDCGCYDCGDSYKFVDWCKGAYSKILAFEPDPANISNCEDKINASPIANFRLIPMGVSNSSKVVEFGSDGGATSHIICDEPIAASDSIVKKRITLQLTTIDDVVGEETIGFIKMDIEGAEFDALHGAKKTIMRDKPLLAICVYHRPGDTLAFMDYLKEIVPEYRFWLRHYGSARTETVLYASVD